MSEDLKTEAAQAGDLGDVDWVARALTLVPQIEAAANDIEKGRQVTDAVMAALHEQAMFKMFLPRSIGGGEATPMEYARVMEVIGGADASTAWCLGQALGCSLASAHLDRDVALDVFGPKNAVLAWGPARGGAKARAVDGGYKSSGLWMFVSGLPQATWVGGHCILCDADGEPSLDKDGKPVTRTMLMPISSAKIIDVWHVLGLRGTGSNNYEVKDVFVPEAYTMWRENVDEIRETGALYRIPIVTAYGFGFSGLALGLAQAMLDEFMKLALQKKARGFSMTLSENPVIQSEFSLERYKILRPTFHVDEAFAELMRDHILIIGFGPSGRAVGEALIEHADRVVVVDLNPQLIKTAQRLGLRAQLGDARYGEILDHLYL
ncbi:MAG: NAD-binding protein, partial [Alphaproteobacteria bacterium]